MSADRLRRLTRDLSACAAFAAMAISGLLPAWLLVVFAIGALVATCGVTLFSASGVPSAVLLLGCGVWLAEKVISLRLDPVIGACTFAAFLTLNRMLSESTPATDHHVHLSGLLMLSGGAALSGDLLFAVCLVLFVPLATTSLALGVVGRHARPDEPLPTRRLLRTVLLGSLASLLAGAVLFVIFPRLSWNLAARPPSGSFGTPTTGFSDRVQLAGDGTLKRDLRPVMRVTLYPDPGVDNLHEYWVGRAFERFDGREWFPTVHKGEVADSITLAPGGKKVIRQWTELLPAYGARTLIALDRPIFFGNALAHLSRRDVRVPLSKVDATEVRFAEPAPSYSYYAYSLPAREEPLSDDERQRALSLPASLDPRIDKLAQTVGGEGAPGKIAERLTQYLHGQFTYSLQLNGSAPDPLADFLFVRKAGHCEHFATALAVLLRERKIPARVVTGFFGGDREDGVYVLRAGDAHAWTEAYLDGRWTRFDATPDDSRGLQASALIEQLARAYDSVDAFWRAHVLDFSIANQAQAFDSVVHAETKSAFPKVNRHWLGWAVLLAGLALVARALLTWKRPKTHEASRLLERAEKVLGRHGQLAKPGEGIEELAERMLHQNHPAALTTQRLTRRYLEARFGQRPLAPGEASGLLRAVQSALKSSDSTR